MNFILLKTCPYNTYTFIFPPWLGIAVSKIALGATFSDSLFHVEFHGISLEILRGIRKERFDGRFYVNFQVKSTKKTRPYCYKLGKDWSKIFT